MQHSARNVALQAEAELSAVDKFTCLEQGKIPIVVGNRNVVKKPARRNRDRQFPSIEVRTDCGEFLQSDQRRRPGFPDHKNTKTRGITPEQIGCPVAGALNKLRAAVNRQQIMMMKSE